MVHFLINIQSLVIGSFEQTVVIDNKSIKISFFDGQSVNLKEFPGIFNTESDCFICCYSTVERETFKNLEDIYIPMCRESNKVSPIIICGTNTELIQNCDPEEVISEKEVHKLKKRYSIEESFRCSCVNAALNQCRDINEVFRCAIKLAYKKKTKKQQRKEIILNCTLL